MRWCPRCGGQWAINRDACDHCQLTGEALLNQQSYASMQIAQQLGQSQLQMNAQASQYHQHQLDALQYALGQQQQAAQNYYTNQSGQLQYRQGSAGLMGNRRYDVNGDPLGGMRQKSKYAIACKNCRCEYDHRAFVGCPSCGAPTPKQEEKMSGQGLYFVPELAEYEKNVAVLNRRKVDNMIQDAKETKSMFGLFIKRKELQMEIQKLNEELDYRKRQEEMRIAEAVQKQRLATNEEVAKVKINAEASNKKISAEHEVELTRIRGARAEEISALKASHSQELSEVKSKAAEDYYEKLSKALAELHQNGDKNSRFIQELALSMMQKSPKLLPSEANISIQADASALHGEKA